MAVCTQYDCFRTSLGSKRKHTPELGRQCCTCLCVFHCFFFFSYYFHFILTAKAKQTEITTTKQKKTRRLNWEERSVVPLFCLFVLKTSLAAESARLSEYKRCLRGNVSEVLCWWLTGKHQGWDCNSVQWVRGRREKNVWKNMYKKIHGCLSNAEKRRWKGGV